MPLIRKVGPFVFLLVCLSTVLEAADWPQWRREAGRGAVSPDELPADLGLRWIKQLPKPRPAWPASQPWLRFDESYSPVAAGKLLYVPSMIDDSVTAYDTDSGATRWKFHTDGPVRLAPLVYEDRVYFGSDDGYLYCVDAGRGSLLWKVRGGSSDRKLLGNQRLISTWPIRGGPVLLDGTIYFTAGIWPFMGVFVHAVDARTGQSVWTNSGYASSYTVQPHNSPAFASLSPRGHLAATEKGLIVPGGRTDPGVFDLSTGKLLGFSFGAKGSGGFHVTARRDWFFVTGTMRRVIDGDTLLSTRATVHDDSALYSLDGEELAAWDLEPETETVQQTDRKGKKLQVSKPRLNEIWRLSLDEAPGRLMLKAGRRFYAGMEEQVAAIDVQPTDGKVQIAWKGAIEGTPWTMLAADHKLFVVTTDGLIYCFGEGKGDPASYPSETARQGKLPDAEAAGSAEKASDLAGPAGGYCLLLGLDSQRVARLTADTDLHLIVVDPDEEKVDAFRRQAAGAGLYGDRVAAHVGDPATYSFPPYLASVIYVAESVFQKVGEQEIVKAVFRALRPYGGKATLPIDAERLEELVSQSRLEGALVAAIDGGLSTLARQGPLPGTADWTHQYADPANSVVSKDQRVKTPLGLLWFGGPANDEVLPRHGHGPSPQVAGGRLFIEGRHMLRALDIYTGRLLWQKELPDLGLFHDNTNHQAGAGEIGGNYVSLPDFVYVAYEDAILELDAATGKLRKQFKLEAGPDDPRPNWGFLAASDDLLIATSTPVATPPSETEPKLTEAVAGFKPLIKPVDESEAAVAKPEPKQPVIEDVLNPTRYSSASRRLVVFQRHTGQRLWERKAKYGFRHNSIAVGAGTLFALDGLSRAKQDALKRRGVDLADYGPRLLALDVRTGGEIWSTSQNVFGTFLNYSEEHDVLLQAGSAYRDRAKDESGTGMVAYRGTDGGVIWQDLKRAYSGPCMLHHDTIITQGPAFSLLTGEPKTRKHPLTGEPVQWQFTRNYGCNTAIASENLITFRSAAAGYYDLAGDGGTGNFGGFKSGCTSNLIVAGGLLNAPEYTRTCQCRYQNQTSLALVHDPDVETWTFNALTWDGKPVRRVGINFGSPGDRRSESETLWLDYPSNGGPSPDLPVEMEIENPEFFRHHSSTVKTVPDTGGHNWVAASGLQGSGRLSITLSKGESSPRKYTIRLHFAEMENLEPGGRVFNVHLRNEPLLSKLDVAREAGTKTALVKEFTGVEVLDRLTISLLPEPGKTAPPILCGLEIVAEGW